MASIYGLLAHVSETVTRLSGDVAELKRDMAEAKRDVRELKSDVAILRETLTGYHASVMGHGILISEPEERVRRIERRLDMGASS